MTACICKYSADSFCYVCDELFAKRAKTHRLSNCIRAGEAGKATAILVRNITKCSSHANQ